ncbi:MAG: tRNA pseudouridine(38-40) synthase TruA [Bacteroidales bacterium]
MAYRYFIRLAYNGSAYSGWQTQPNAVSVQHWVEKGLLLIAGNKNGVTGCGRTDTGVHARNFYAHFDAEVSFTSDELTQIAYKLNRFLPQDIVIFTIDPVIPGSHARFSALWREYEYLIIKYKDPFNFQHAYFEPAKLDLDKINLCCALLLGRHDYQCFSKVHTQVNNFFCDILVAKWEEQDHTLKFTIRADRFLRNMVRAIVGTLLDVGKGKIPVEEFRKIINSHNRSEAGYSVPAKGLSLTEINYPNDLYASKPVFYNEIAEAKTISHYYTTKDAGFDADS